MTSARRRLTADGVVVATTQLLTTLLYALSFRLITEAFSPRVFGEATLWTGIVTFVFALIINPILSTHFRFYPEYRERGLAEWFNRQVGRYLRKVVGALALAGSIAASVWAISEGWSRLSIGVCLIAILAGNTALARTTNVLGANRRHGRLLPLRLLRTASYPVAATLLAYIFEPTLLFLLFATVASLWLPYVAAVLLGWTRSPRDRRQPAASEGTALMRSGYLYGAPFAIIAIATWVSSLGDRYILAYYLTTSDVGVYAAVYGLFTQPFLVLAGGLALWLRPVLFDAMAVGQVSAARALLRRWIAAGFACSLAGGAILWLTRDWWFKLLLANEYHHEGFLVLFVLIGSSMHVVSSALSHHLMAAKQTRAQLMPLVLAALVNIAGNFVFVPRWGLDGAGFATAISFTFHALFLAIVVSRTSLSSVSLPGPSVSKPAEQSHGRAPLTD
jgi:O-antigen/teichoic acid export membrane protein